MACGPGKGLLQLQKLAAEAQEGVDNVKDAVEGFADNLNGAAAAMDEKLSKLIEGAKGMIPEIELPDFGDFTLPDLKLPELNLPEISLQLEVTSILDKINSNDPAVKAQALLNLESLQEKFPDLSLEEIEQLKADILSGKIDKDNLCKKVKDLVKEDGKVIEKGVPITAPEESTPDETVDVVIPSVEAEQEAANNLPEAKEEKKSQDKIVNIKAKWEEARKDRDEAKEKIKSLMPHINISF